MTEIFKMLFLMSCAGTALAAILAAVRPITKKLFSSSWHYYMWLVVLCVMVLPIRLHLPATPVMQSVQRESYTASNEEMLVETLEVAEKVESVTIEDEAILTENDEAYAFIDLNWMLFSYVWLMGMVLSLLGKMISYGIFIRQIHTHSQVVDCPAIVQYTKRKVIVRVSDGICSPLMLGVCKPVLVLPKTELSEKQLQYIMAHECTHLNRQDILYKWFLSIVKSIHWFNPFIYLITQQIHLDCEIACDMAVVQQMNQNETKGYVETILLLLTTQNAKQVPLTTGMTGTKKTLKKRFAMIKNKMTVKTSMTVLSVILAVVLLSCGIVISGVLNGKTKPSAEMATGIQTDQRRGNEFNFLMLGIDNNGRADAIMVFNVKEDGLTGLSFPRNVNFTSGEESGRMSDLLAKENGDQLVVDAIRSFGIPMHYYAKVNIEAVETLIDNVGGLQLNIPEDMVYDDPYQNLHIDIPAGLQRLSGEQVGQVLRYRRYPNGEEGRSMTWYTVMTAFVNQIQQENKTIDVGQLYETVAKHITTNYSLEDLIKDIPWLSNINRNNVVFEGMPGQNITNADGTFGYQINMAEAKSLLRIFNADTSNEQLISVIPYENDVMGFSIKLPERWKGKYDVMQYDNQVVFFHKGIFLKYGKGFGQLFSITKLTPPLKEETAEPVAYLYWAKDYAFAWSVASDVQHPVWADNDEQDEKLAEDFEDMLRDLEFIKNSFSVLAPQPSENNIASDQKLQGNAEEATAYNKTIQIQKRVHPISGEVRYFPVSVKVSAEETTPTDAIESMPTAMPVAIKSNEKSDIPYVGFENLILENADIEKMQALLKQKGSVQGGQHFTKLSESYIVNDYSYENDLQHKNTGITCDANGNISVYFAVNSDNLVDISFFDSETKESVGSYLVLANNENAYSFLGFDQNKTYDINIQGKTQGTWQIDGEYLVY